MPLSLQQERIDLSPVLWTVSTGQQEQMLGEVRLVAEAVVMGVGEVDDGSDWEGRGGGTGRRVGEMRWRGRPWAGGLSSGARAVLCAYTSGSTGRRLRHSVPAWQVRAQLWTCEQGPSGRVDDLGQGPGLGGTPGGV